MALRCAAMEPSNPSDSSVSSRSSLSPRDARLVAEALLERWGPHLRPDERFTVSGETDPHEARVTLCLERVDGSVRLPLEARLDRARCPRLDAQECTYLLLDLLDAWIGQHLESERLDRPPIDWTDTEWSGIVVQVRGELRNLAAEQAAAEWLAAHDAQVDDGDDSE